MDGFGATAATGFAGLETFFFTILGEKATADSLQKAGMSFFGVQGPWYTVGWVMARTTELADGRAALIARICQPVELVRRYNAAADRVDPTHALPRWSDTLMRALPITGRTPP